MQLRLCWANRIAVLAIALPLAVGCTGGTGTVPAQSVATPVPIPTLTAAQVATLQSGIEAKAAGRTVTSIVVTTIKQESAVFDAAVSLDGNQVSLVVVVRSATNVQEAKRLGENFLRLYKTLSDDDPPGREIGSGRYDYLIGIYYPNEKMIAQGAKSRVASRISW